MALRIGIPISTFLLGTGLPGIDKYAYNLILALERIEGVEILVFQEKYRDNGPFDRFDIRYFPILKEFLGIRQHHEPVQAADDVPPPVKKEISDFSRLRRGIVKSLSYLSRGVDVIHYPSHMEDPLRWTFSKTVLTFHDLVPMVRPETSTQEIVDRFNRCVERLGYVDELLTVSEFSRSEMVTKLGVDASRITVAHNGVDKIFFLERPDEKIARKYSGGFPYILFVGTLEPRKNVEVLIEAFGELDEPELKLLLVGKEGWESERVHSKVRESGLESAVIFPGYVPEEELPFLYQSAEVFVYPSLYEGFGMPVLEAMAAGAPVVTSNTSSLPEVAGDAAILVSPDSVSEIAEAIRGVMGNNQLRRKLTDRGKKRAGGFTWDRCARRTLEAYCGSPES